MSLRSLSVSSLALALLLVAGCKSAESAEMGDPAIGAPAPAFTAVDSNGKSHSLADFKGKYVVLEWLNHGCPYVVKHYESKNMQGLQKEYTAKGVVWLSIISSVPGKQGHSTPAKANEDLAAKGAASTAVLLDEKSDIGRLYGAKTTPHMFVIDAAGNVIYKGAIDDKPTTDTDDIAGATNYVRAALDAAMAGKAVAVAQSKPYGCSVKY